MKIEKLNNGFYKLGDDEYRVEAPVREPSVYKLEDFTLPNGRNAQRYVTVVDGKKLRSGMARKDKDGNFTEAEPKMWHIYKMKKFVRDGVDKVGLDVLDDNFEGTAVEAFAVCEAHKVGG